jgi:hypothetical protein
MLRTAHFWYVLLLITCIAAAYLAHVRPRTRADWLMLRTTIAFLTWLLVGLISVRAEDGITRPARPPVLFPVSD